MFLRLPRRQEAQRRDGLVRVGLAPVEGGRVLRSIFFLQLSYSPASSGTFGLPWLGLPCGFACAFGALAAFFLFVVDLDLAAVFFSAPLVFPGVFSLAWALITFPLPSLQTFSTGTQHLSPLVNEPCSLTCK